MRIGGRQVGSIASTVAFGAVLLLNIMVLSGCGGDSDPPDVPVSEATTTVPRTTVSPDQQTTSPPVEPDPAPSTTEAVAHLSPDEIYAMVSPSIPLIETPVATGSGILIEGGFVVTNHHVVWPYQKAWVVFPDGTEYADVPVLGFDPFADLAVLGPIDVPVSPLALADGEAMNPGSEVYLIGYPAETDRFPEPTITSGILSRFRQWELYDLTLLQSDAAIAGGQSGGALVNAMGEVIGISTWSFSEAGFSVATSAADDAEIVSWIIDDYRRFGAPDPFSDEESDMEQTVDLAHLLDGGLFWFDGVAGSIVDVLLDGPDDGVITVVGPTLEVVMAVDDYFEGLEYGTVELPVDGPYFVVVTHLAESLGETSSFTLSSSAELTPFYDPDDGQSLVVGGLVGAMIDHYADVDWYSIELSQGEMIVIWTEAIATDTAVYVGHSSGSTLEMAWDDDSGPALFGNSTNAQLVYTAPVTGEYYIFVEDPAGTGGGYFLGVDQGQPVGEGPVVQEPTEEEPIEEEPRTEADGSAHQDLDLGFDVNPETTWQEIFDVFESGEQDCIRQYLDEVGLFDFVLASPAISDDVTDQVAGILQCLRHVTAAELFISMLAASGLEDGVLLDQTHVTCFREVFAGEDGAALLDALVSAAEPEGELAEKAVDLLLCFPPQALEP